MKTRTRLLPVVLLTLSQGLLAQQIPGGGSQLRQIPAAPVPQKPAPEIRIEEATPAAAPASDTVSVLVTELQVSGARAFPEAELVAVAGFTPGSMLTLSELQAMAARITGHYRSHGYFVARAYLPAQDVTDNVVVSRGQRGHLRRGEAAQPEHAGRRRGTQPAARPQQR